MFETQEIIFQTNLSGGLKFTECKRYVAVNGIIVTWELFSVMIFYTISTYKEIQQLKRNEFKYTIINQVWYNDQKQIIKKLNTHINGDVIIEFETRLHNFLLNTGVDTLVEILKDELAEP